MKALKIVPVVLAASFATASTYAHKHDDEQTGHGHGHEQMMESHHDDMMQGEMDHSAMGHSGMGHGGDTAAHGDGHSHGHEPSLAGKPGKESDVDRTIKVEASDSMRFTHAPFNIKNGETIKFEVTNTGAVAHEFAIGTKDEHMAHGKMMMANPGMHHGPGGNAITLEPGETKTLIWYFEEAFEVEAACNIPGHYQAGMHSPVTFEQ